MKPKDMTLRLNLVDLSPLGDAFGPMRGRKGTCGYGSCGCLSGGTCGSNKCGCPPVVGID